MPPSTFENFLILYARRFPIRRGKLRVINSLWRAAVGEPNTHRVATLKHGGFRMPCDLGENGQARLKRFRGELGTNDGMNFVLRDLGDSGTERVQAVCIDQFCKDHSITYIDLMKIDIQGHEYSALEGAERLIRSGHVGIIFLELNWAKDANASCAAAESIRFLEQAGYRFSRPGQRLNWERAGDWLESVSDVVAKRVRP